MSEEVLKPSQEEKNTKQKQTNKQTNKQTKTKQPRAIAKKRFNPQYFRNLPLLDISP